MFARQTGFLHATVKDQPQSRMEQWLAGGADLGLPDLGDGEYLHDLMAELCPFRLVGEHYQPTDWHIIAPFGHVIGLDPDDMQTLALMCRGYFVAWREGENPLCIPPVDRQPVDKGDTDATR